MGSDYHVDPATVVVRLRIARHASGRTGIPGPFAIREVRIVAPKALTCGDKRDGSDRPRTPRSCRAAMAQLWLTRSGRQHETGARERSALAPPGFDGLSPSFRPGFSPVPTRQRLQLLEPGHRIIDRALMAGGFYRTPLPGIGQTFKRSGGLAPPTAR